jgi:hypothetical protein
MRPHLQCQDTNLALACKSRVLMPALRLVTVPKPPLPGMGTPFASRWSETRPLSGAPDLGWLKSLKTSNRNCLFNRSVSPIIDVGIHSV